MVCWRLAQKTRMWEQNSNTPRLREGEYFAAKLGQQVAQDAQRIAQSKEGGVVCHMGSIAGMEGGDKCR